MNPLLAACQLVNVALPGAEPPLAQAQEDMRLFSPALVDQHGEGGGGRTLKHGGARSHEGLLTAVQSSQ